MGVDVITLRSRGCLDFNELSFGVRTQRTGFYKDAIAANFLAKFKRCDVMRNCWGSVAHPEPTKAGNKFVFWCALPLIALALSSCATVDPSSRQALEVELR